MITYLLSIMQKKKPLNIWMDPMGKNLQTKLEICIFKQGLSS
jgi:hypothetical protein